MPLPTLEQEFVDFRERGSTRALARVFDELAPELLLIAGHLHATGQDADDLLQATFLDAIQNAHRYEPGRPLLPWLTGILVNCALRERRRGRRIVDPDRLPVREELGPEREAEARELADGLADALRGLPRGYREPMSLRLVHGLSPREIAHALGIPRSTVTTKLQRGREILRRALPASLAMSALATLTPARSLETLRTEVLAAGARYAAGIGGASLLALPVAKAAAVAVLALTTWAVARVLSGDDGGRPGSRAPAELGVAPAVAEVAGGEARSAVARPSAGAPDADRADRIEAGSSAARLPVASGLVVHPDGTSAAGAEIWIESTDGGPHRLATRADERGAFAVSGAAGALFFARHPGRVPSSFEFIGGGNRTEGFELRLGAAGARIDALIVDTRGRPVAGATAVIVVDSAMPTVATVAEVRHPRGSVLVRSDAAGRVLSDELPPGTHSVFATAPELGGAEQRIVVERGSVARCTLALGPCAVIAGRVTAADGAPVAQAVVSAVPAAAGLPGFDSGASSAFSRATTSDADGRYTLCVAGGRTRVAVAVDDSVCAIAEVSAIEGHRVDLDLAAAEPTFVQGEVAVAGASAGPGWRVVLVRGRARAEALTDDAGRFALAYTGDEPGRVLVFPPELDGIDDAAWLVLAFDHPPAEPLRLRVSTARTIVSGRAVGDDGEALAHAAVAHVPAAGGGFARAVCDADGRFRIGPVPPAAGTIEIVNPATGERFALTVAESADAERTVGDVSFAARATVEFVAAGPAAALGDVRLELTPHLGTPRPFEAPAAGDGRWRARLAPGRYGLVAVGSGVALSARVIEVDGDAEIVLELAPGVPVSFAFDSVDPAAWQSMDKLAVAVVDASGRAVLPTRFVDLGFGARATQTLGLPPGHYRVQASSFLGARGGREFIVPAGAAGVDVAVAVGFDR